MSNNLNMNAARFLNSGQLGSPGVSGTTSYLNSAFGSPGNGLDPSYTNVGLKGRPVLPVLNSNLAKRSHFLSRNIVPSPYVQIDPRKPSPFSANLQINKTHKGTVFGSRPENILNRYRYQKDLFAKELEQKQYNLRQMNLESAKRQAQLQQGINSTASLKAIRQAELNKAIELARQAELNKIESIKKDEAIKTHRIGLMYPPPPKKPESPVKKTLWQRMTGRGRSRKNRKTQRNRKSRRN
jgi:hypothetical protein